MKVKSINTYIKCLNVPNQQVEPWVIKVYHLQIKRLTVEGKGHFVTVPAAFLCGFPDPSPSHHERPEQNRLYRCGPELQPFIQTQTSPITINPTKDD